jgi:hypothetical protein
MRRIISAVLMTVSIALAAPAGVLAAQHHATTTATRRIYDPYRRDYHRWTQSEERAYRAYLAEQHRTYLSYQRQRAAERRAYWHWRHEREERLERERR